jgi:hypothetical protein
MIESHGARALVDLQSSVGRAPSDRIGAMIGPDTGTRATLTRVGCGR